MNITLQGIAPGKWRNFTGTEINIINQLLQNSSKTEEASKLSSSTENWLNEQFAVEIEKYKHRKPHDIVLN